MVQQIINKATYVLVLHDSVPLSDNNSGTYNDTGNIGDLTTVILKKMLIFQILL